MKAQQLTRQQLIAMIGHAAAYAFTQGYKRGKAGGNGHLTLEFNDLRNMYEVRGVLGNETVESLFHELSEAYAFFESLTV